MDNPELIERLKHKDISKFIALEIPLQLARDRYAQHFETVLSDVDETDELRVLDSVGSRAFNLFSLKELGEPFVYDSTGDPNPKRKKRS